MMMTSPKRKVALTLKTCYHNGIAVENKNFKFFLGFSCVVKNNFYVCTPVKKAAAFLHGN